jgi:hypothetical protein
MFMSSLNSVLFLLVHLTALNPLLLTAISVHKLKRGNNNSALSTVKNN